MMQNTENVEVNLPEGITKDIKISGKLTSSTGNGKTKKNEEKLSNDGKQRQDSEHQMKFMNGTEPTNDSNKPWPLPTNLKDFTRQTNKVANMVLNEEINFDKAQLYSSLAKSVGQAMNTEVYKARLSRTIPNLDLEEEE